MWGDWGQLKNCRQNKAQKARCAEKKEGRLEADRELRSESRRKGPGCCISVLEDDLALSIAGCSPPAQGGRLRLISFCQSQFSYLFPGNVGTWAATTFIKKGYSHFLFSSFPFFLLFQVVHFLSSLCRILFSHFTLSFTFSLFLSLFNFFSRCLTALILCNYIHTAKPLPLFWPEFAVKAYNDMSLKANMKIRKEHWLGWMVYKEGEKVSKKSNWRCYFHLLGLRTQ